MSYDANQLSYQSAAFNDANKQEIDLTRKLLLKGAEALSLALIEAKAHANARLQERLDAWDLDGCFTIVRSTASTFVSAGLSRQFWAWVDAVGFFADCISTRWTYLNIEQRQKYLEWAMRDARQVLSTQ